MMSDVNEPIEVGAIFGRDKKLIKPVWFIWEREKYFIKEITYIWKSSEGRADLYHFSVTDGENLYHISYSMERMIWRLCNVELEGS